ncbi:hypothetical protein D3C76_1594070 [compost metagenome]
MSASISRRSPFVRSVNGASGITVTFSRLTEALRSCLTSCTGICVSTTSSSRVVNDKTRGSVIAPLQALVGVSFAYFQLLIHPIITRRPSCSGISDQVTPA